MPIGSKFPFGFLKAGLQYRMPAFCYSNNHNKLNHILAVLLKIK
jgi:hypothetical protein